MRIGRALDWAFVALLLGGAVYAAVADPDSARVAVAIILAAFAGALLLRMRRLRQPFR
jgi:hypothetical protein